MTQGKQRLPGELPFLPLYNQVLLPGAFARVHFKRSGPVSGPLLEYLFGQQGEQVLVAAVPILENDVGGQVDILPDSDEAGDVKPRQVATAARVLQITRNTQTGGWIVTLEGWCRIYTENTPRERRLAYLLVGVQQVGPAKDARFREEPLDKEGRELADALQVGVGKLAGPLNQSVGSFVTSRLADLIQKLSPPAAADMLASMLTRDTAFKQLVLEAVDNNDRLRLVNGLLQQTLQSFKGDGKQGEDDSRKQLVMSPLPMLPGPAGKGASGANDPEEEEEEDLAALIKRLRAAKPPAEVLKVANREHKRLKKSSEHHPGYAMSRAYLETLADLPWNTFSSGRMDVGQAASDSSSKQTTQGFEDAPTQGKHSDGAVKADTKVQEPTQPRNAGQLSLAEARALLDKDHYGLDKVKDRIVQYLAVRRLKGADARAPILCFVGPPGTGKTSLASSISKVLLRPFQRVSVGGVRDEAEIRGHRRTYIGAMPGRVIQALKSSGVRDPILLLDEVDKMGHDSLRGDPASALLEVLDPNQNQAFVDTYLSVPFNLSQVVFVATANQLQNMSGPLLDRLEVIQLSGYTLEEKRHIAERHLIPGLLAEHGLAPHQLAFPSDSISLIADGYTREAGVRSLSRNLAAICRHVAVQIVSQQDDADSACSHEQQESHYSSTHDSSPVQDLKHPSNQAQQNQQQQRPHADDDSGALDQDVESGTTASPGGFFWGSMWGGLKGAFVPSRHHPSGTQSRHHAAADHEQAQAARHSSPVQMSRAHADQAGALQRQNPQHWHKSTARPEVSLAFLPQSPGRSGLSVPTSRLHESQEEASNPYGGVNSDMAKPSGSEVHMVTVTAELVEEVLGPRKYNESDSADSLALPGSAAGLVWTAVGGQVQYVECCCTSTGQPQRPGKLVLTGQAGEVLQESAHLALSWIRSHTHHLAAAAAATATAAASSAPQTRQADEHLRPQPAAEALPVVPPDEDASSQFQMARNGLMLAAEMPSTSNALQSLDHMQQVQRECSEQGRPAKLAVSARDSEQCDARQSASNYHCSGLNGHFTAVGFAEETTDRAAASSGMRDDGQIDVATAAAQWDVHVHLPAGAVSKDGPSAGITLATAMVSLFLGRMVRADTAMTGELTLRGLVLPIGGLKEKLLAAHHAGIKRVLVPHRNWRDIKADIPANLKDNIEIIPVHVLEDVLQHAFEPSLSLKPANKL